MNLLQRGVVSMMKSLRLISSEDATGFLFNSVDRTSFGRKSAGEYLAYAESSMYVAKGINIRAENVSDVQFTLKKKNGDVIDDPFNPYLLLLERPNPNFTGKQFWKLLQKFLDVTGEAYVYLDSKKELFKPDKVDAMWILPSQMVTVNFAEDGTKIENYTYKTAKATNTIPADKVIRFYEPDMLNPMRGVSLLASGIRQIETDIQLTEHMVNILKNGGSVDGVFKFKSSLTKEQIALAKELYKQEMAGAQKTGTPLFLGGDADYVRLGLTPVELAYLQSKQFTLDDIATLTDVPRALLARTADETYANADAARAIFLREKIRPLISNIVSVLDWRFIPDDLSLDFVDPTPANQESLRLALETANTIGALTTNEKRVKLGELGFEDLDPIKDPEADQVLISFSMGPLVKEDVPPALVDPVAPDPNADPNAQKRKSAWPGHPLHDKDLRAKWGLVQVKRLNRRQRIFLKGMQTYFGKQEARVIENLVGSKDFDLGEDTKSLVDRIFDQQLEAKLAGKFALPILQALLQEAGENVFSLLETNYDFHVTSDIHSWLGKRINHFADEINGTTYNRLKSEFERSFAAGESRDQLVGRIRATYDGFSEKRAETIARTEVHGAIQKGSTEGYRQAGVEIKIWVWAPGTRGGAREDHIAIDGEEVPLDMPFSNGLMYPGDPGADPSETVNCECSI